MFRTIPTYTEKVLVYPVQTVEGQIFLPINSCQSSNKNYGRDGLDRTLHSDNKIGLEIVVQRNGLNVKLTNSDAMPDLFHLS